MIYRVRRPGLGIGDRAILAVTLLTVLAFGVRYLVAGRQGLDADEVFSLALATGHSIEQPASESQAALGDFIQADTPQLPEAYRRYAEHDAKPAGMSRVIRAVYLSDTNPPLYYVVLNLWTRFAGTGDMELRLMSIILASLCVPLTFVLAKHLYGRVTGLMAASFMTFATQSVYYGSLGRMYPLLLLLVLSSAILVVKMHRRGATPLVGAGWVIVSAAGFLTHYFFAFAWLAMVAWILVHNHRARRIHLIALSALALLLAAPWYMRVPESMQAWRVTKGWLDHPSAGFNPLVAQVRLLTGYFTVSGDWLNRQGYTDYVLVAVITLAAIAAIVSMRRLLRSRSSQLLIFWLVATNAGLLVFDVIQHTYARQQSRYAFAALPAALILFAAVVERLPPKFGVLAFFLPLVLWANGLRRLNAEPSGDNPFRGIAQSINAAPHDGKVVVVHAIPTAVIGMARYLGDSIRVMDWVEALGTRNPEAEASRLIADSRGLTLVISPPGKEPAEAPFFRSRAASSSDSRGTGYERIDFVFKPKTR